MANEFIARKGLIVSGSTTLTGSLVVAEGITGSLFGTSSWAVNALTSSFLLGGIESASFATNAATASFLLGDIESASFATNAATASFLLGGIESASFATNAATASFVDGIVESASFATTALTASFLLGGIESAEFATSASRAETASLALAVDYANVNNKPTLISASSQVSYTGLSDIPAGILSSSTQINNLENVSASYALTASFVSNVLKTKAGSVANTLFGGTPLTASVTFNTTLDTTDYAIQVIGEDARAWIIQDKTAEGFIINSISNTALAGTTYWTCTVYGEN